MERLDGIVSDRFHCRARLLLECSRPGDGTSTTSSFYEHGMRAHLRRSNGLPTAAEWRATSVEGAPSRATHSTSIIHITETAAHQSVRPRRPSGQRRRKSLRCTAKEGLYDEQRKKRQMHRTGGGALNPLARVDLTSVNCEQAPTRTHQQSLRQVGTLLLNSLSELRPRPLQGRWLRTDEDRPDQLPARERTSGTTSLSE